MTPRLDILLPHLHTGGIEVGLVRLAPHLVAGGLDVRFILQEDSGDLRGKLPPEIPVIALNSGGMLGTARALVSRWKASPCDVVYTATNALNIAHLIAHRLSGRAAPVAVVGEHIPLEAFLATRKQPWLRRAAMRATYGRAAAVVAPSRPILDEHRALLGRACPPVHVLNNPVIDAVAPLEPLAGQARRFVSLGRLSVEKGFDLALEMMARYHPHDPQAELTIYGEGAERAALEALRAKLGLDAVVHFPGRTENVAQALAAADVFICTSKVEGFGNAIVEAQAAGVPVLSVDCPFGPRLLLQDGTAGQLVTTRDPDALAQGLLAFANDPQHRANTRALAHQSAAEYTVTRSAQMHLALFRTVTGCPE